MNRKCPNVKEIERLEKLVGNPHTVDRGEYIGCVDEVKKLRERIAELEAELEGWKDSCDPGVDKE
jgi:hypothetical protein